MSDTLTQALSKAQGEFPAIKKDCVNPHFKNRYASLEAILTAVRPVLSKHGIAISSGFECNGDGHLKVVTKLHRDGGVLESSYPIDTSGLNDQKIGSAITYARRYSISALLCIAADDDDDGNAASEAKAKVKMASSIQVKTLLGQGKSIGLTPEQIIRGACKGTKAKLLEQLTFDQATAALERLEDKVMKTLKAKSEDIKEKHASSVSEVESGDNG